MTKRANLSFLAPIAAGLLLTGAAIASDATNETIAEQNKALMEATAGKGFGPQSPRDLSTREGSNPRMAEMAPPAAEMNLCNIHFHENAEHKGGEFTTYAGPGNGKGAGTGFKYDGELSEAETASVDRTIGAGDYGNLAPGDTIELHYVHTTAQVEPGPTLGACLSEAMANPQLRVEGQVYVLVNDENAADFTELNKVEKVGDVWQAVNMPTDTGTPLTYKGSTTGPSYNTKGSPLLVSWSVRPQVKKVSIASVEKWLADNRFDETAAHGVRNLVTAPELISNMN